MGAMNQAKAATAGALNKAKAAAAGALSQAEGAAANDDVAKADSDTGS